MNTDVTVHVRDEGLRRLGQLEDFTNLKAALRYARTSTWTLSTTTTSADDIALLTAGAGVIVSRDDTVLFSGPIDVKTRTKNADGDRTLLLAGVDDSAWLDWRLALPVPAGPPFTATAYDDRTAAAETVLRHYVDRNLGPAARADRQLARLVLPADQGRGLQVRGRARFQSLSELLPPLALAGGDLGFRIVQVDEHLEFQVTEPTDRSGTVVFSEELGNLAGYSYRQGKATTNFAYVGGGGEGIDRVIVDGGDATSIASDGRREVFADRRDSSDPAVLEQTRDERLLEGRAPTALSLSPVDLENLVYGIDYQLGDQVTVVVEEERIVDAVREVTLDVTPSRGVSVTPVIGTPGARDPRVPALFTALTRQARRVAHLERR